MSRLRLHPVWTTPGVLLGMILAGPATASTFTAAQLAYDNAILSQFNLVNINNLSAGSDTEGRVAVGGTATATGGTRGVCTVGCTGGNTSTSVDPTNNKYGALTVFGNITGGYSVGKGGDIDVGGNTGIATYNLNNAGAFNVGGTSVGTTVQAPTAVRTAAPVFGGIITNAPGVTAQTNVASAFPFQSFANTFTTPLTALAQGIAALPGSPGVTAQALPTGNNVFLTANNDYTAHGKSYGVVTTTLANLASEQNFQGISNNGNAATLVIVTGDGANYTLPNLNSYTDASKVIFDFVNATTLKFGGTFYGTILAPLANITQQGGALDGSVVVASINQTNLLRQDALFNGDLSGLAVPEPASLLVLATGVAATLARRRLKPRG